MLANRAAGRVTPRGVFVTGTDTGVGKTVTAACLVRKWHADYWKPAQTGLAEEPGDSETIATLGDLPPHRLHRPRHAFAAPLSVQAAAAAEGNAVALDDFVLPQTNEILVVEGAGGVLVPLSAQALMADLMLRLALPVILVARTALGTINHTLLSLEALRARHLRVLGVVFVGDPAPETEATIAGHGAVRILASLPRLASVSPASVATLSETIPGWQAALA